MLAMLAALAALAALACSDSNPPTSSAGNDGEVLFIEPSRASFAVGRNVSLNAQLFDGRGKPVVAPSVSWTSEDNSVASVSLAGEVTGRTVGTTRITAASRGVSSSAEITVLPFPAAARPMVSEHGGYFVSPSGSTDASGSITAPWDLATALSGGAGGGRVQPGDTIWLREGDYPGRFESSLAGSAETPIVVRAYPGERATIDGSMVVEGSYTWYWGFEVENTDPTTQNVMGIDSHCPGCRFINLVIHDHSGDGLGMWSEGPDQEAYGNIIYNNGFHGSTDRSFGHGIYAQNIAGAKRLIDNIFVNQFGYGIHIYTEEGGMWNFIVTGNIAVNSGQGSGMDYQVGGLQPVENLTFTDNMSYRSPDRRGNTARLGFAPQTQNAGATVTGNYLVGKLLLVSWKLSTIVDNTILDGALPNSTKVFVEPNLYEPGRGNVIVFNWGGQSSVQVDLSELLARGDGYEVRDAQNYYGPPVASGRYAGGSVSIPIASRKSAPSITGKSLSSTGTQFAAYVIVAR